MRQTQIVLLSALALTLVGVGGLLVTRLVSHDDRHKTSAEAQIKIAVATQETLKNLDKLREEHKEERRESAQMAAQAAAAESAKVADKGVADVIARKEKKSTKDGAADDAQSGAQSAGEKPPPTQDQAAQAAVGALASLAGAQLEGALIGALADSGRFAPLESTKVINAIQQVQGGALEARSEGEQNKSTWAKVVSVFGGSPGKQSEKRVAGAGVNDQPNLAKVGKSLQVEFFLYVGVEEPSINIFWERNEITGSGSLVIRAQPTIQYRLFDTREGTVISSAVIRLPRPIIERISENEIREASAVAGLEALVSARNQKVQLAYNKSISILVMRAVLDKIAPAKVTSAAGEYVVNRGANDGWEVGEMFEIHRPSSGRIVEESGRALEARRSLLGRVRVVDVQQTISTISPLSGEALEVGDLVLQIPNAKTPAQAGGQAAGSVPGAVALGEAGLREQRRLRDGGKAAAIPAVAIDSIQVLLRDGAAKPAITLGLSSLLSSALSGDRRIQILPRVALAQLKREREINAPAGGGSDISREEGLAQSGFLLTGNAVVDAKTSSQSVTVEGKTRVRPGSQRTSLVAKGAFITQTIDGVQVNGFEVTARRDVASVDQASIEAVLQDLARVAAAKFMNELFPVKVLRVDGETIRIVGGELAGLRIGSKLKAYSVGQPVVDDVSGVVISDGVRDYVGEVVVTDVGGQVSSARFVSRPFALKAGDVLEGVGEAVVAAPRRAAQPADKASAPNDPAPFVRF